LIRVFNHYSSKYSVVHSSTLAFLRDLATHNDKSWFDAHRSSYESARNHHIEFIAELIDGIAAFDPDIAGQTAKSTLFRINRDVRFSKNKAPYKTNFGASLARGGRKSTFAGYYFHLEPGASFVGGGMWMPAPADLAKVRQEIDYCLDEFRGIVESSAFGEQFRGLSDGADMRLQRVPKGYEADNPAATFLKYKSFVAMKPLQDALLCSDRALKESIDACKALHPLLKFLNRAVSE
jgi:uncharacterized protein (TIGR02453 family)